MKDSRVNSDVNILLFLEVLAELNHRLTKKSIELAREEGVKTTTPSFDLRKCEHKVGFEIYLEVEWNAVAACWWLDISSESGIWIVELALLETREGRQDVIRYYPERKERTIEGLISAIGAFSELMNHSIDEYVVKMKGTAHNPESQQGL